MGIRDNLTGAAALQTASELKKIRELLGAQVDLQRETNRLLFQLILQGGPND